MKDANSLITNVKRNDKNVSKPRQEISNEGKHKTRVSLIKKAIKAKKSQETVLRPIPRRRTASKERIQQSTNDVEGDDKIPDNNGASEEVTLCANPKEEWAEWLMKQKMKYTRKRWRVVHLYKPNNVTTVAGAANPTMNRYEDIRCLDVSRVILKPPGVDYYHANWVTSDEGQRFICAQGPMDSTIGTFWRMITQESVACIVMLCRTNEIPDKCSVYYPSMIGESMAVGDGLCVKTESSEMDGVVSSTVLTVTQENNRSEGLKVHHLWYDGWDDHTVPVDTSGFLELKRKLLSVTKKFCADSPPILIHCSAGVGRTCTFLASLMLYHRISQKMNPSVVNIVRHIRDSRLSAVQLTLQYLFIQVCVLDEIAKELNLLKTDRYMKFIAEYDKYRIKTERANRTMETSTHATVKK